MSAAADLGRLKRLQAQLERGGQSDPALAAMIERAEASTAVDVEAAGAPEQRTEELVDDEHADGCDCGTCSCDGDDCGAWDADVAKQARFRRGATVTKSGQQFRARRLTRHGAEPGASDDWELIGRSPAAPAARSSSTKRLRLFPDWKPFVAMLKAWSHEQFATKAEVERITKAGGTSSAELGDVVARLEAVERRLAEGAKSWAASNLADCYRGVFQDNGTYSRGELCTYGGSMWIALADNSERPGTGGGWQLCVKHGRAAK